MKILNLFTDGVSKVVDSVGNILDDLVTTDEEKKQIKLQIQEEINKFKNSQIDALMDHEREITKRHSADMKSDSWLSKNIRPLCLAFLTLATVLLAYLTIFILPVEKVALIEPWQDLLKILLITAYGFYFGSRGMEKINLNKTNQDKS